MRRFIVPALMISLLLSACGSGAVQRKVAEQRERFAAAEEIVFTADITANLGKEVFQCTLSCAASPEIVTMEVVAPESVAGVRARLENGEAALEYEGISLGIGTAGLDSITPVSAVPLLMSALRSGFMQRCWMERDGEETLVAEEVYVTDEAALTVWYNESDMAPVACEFSQEGRVILRCEIRGFTLR